MLRESEAPTSLDALLADPASSGAQQPTSRRDLRSQPARSAKRTPAKQTRPVKTSRGVAGIEQPETRRLRRSERAILRRADVSPKGKRRNPVSGLVTMVVVGGMFGLAALPAYATATADQTTASTKTDTTQAQTLAVASSVTALAPARDGYAATSPEALITWNRDELLAANNAEYLASGARELGDDYPWAWQLSDDQGGGLSPLNYYYRQCVDFVAWRMNRDQGYYAAPFKWVWSTLTPYGGNGGQWQYNWEQLGRVVSTTPVPGAVAYTGGNHIAYVKTVYPDGTVLLEEYNYVPDRYSQRIVPASSIVSFLYPPS